MQEKVHKHCNLAQLNRSITLAEEDRTELVRHSGADYSGFGFSAEWRCRCTVIVLLCLIILPCLFLMMALIW